MLAGVRLKVSRAVMISLVTVVSETVLYVRVKCRHFFGPLLTCCQCLAKETYGLQASAATGDPSDFPESSNWQLRVWVWAFYSEVSSSLGIAFEADLNVQSEQGGIREKR